MKPTCRTTPIIVALAALAVSAAPASAQAAKRAGTETQKQLAAQARIAAADAKKIALAKVPGGWVKSSELEREEGKLVYSFDIATKGKPGVDEVLVDAATGQVVGGVKHETPAMEKAEARAEAREKKASAKELKKP